MDGVEAWARVAGVEWLLPEAFPDEPERDPRRDFGGVVRGAPSLILRPADVPGLARTLAFLAERELPYRLRGGAWSSGGQVVSDGGVVVDLTGLDRILDDRAAEDEITVEGGATWRSVWSELRKTGRRPLIAPDNLRATVGGSLAIGEVGDTSSVHGLTICQVARLTLVTPDGQVRRLSGGDKLFRFTLGGGGLTGAIAEVTLRTARRPATLVSRRLAWQKIENFCAEAPLNCDLRLYEVFAGALTWLEGSPVLQIVAGNFADAAVPGEAGLWELLPSAASAPEIADRFAGLSSREVVWDVFRPGLQVTVPLEVGGEALRRLAEFIRAEPILRAHLPRAGVVVYKTDERFPLAPQPRSRLALAFMLRPQVADRAIIERILPHMQTIGRLGLEVGGKIGLSSIPLGIPNFARLQLGSALDDLVRLKTEIDPRWLCNRDAIPGLDRP